MKIEKHNTRLLTVYEVFNSIYRDSNDTKPENVVVGSLKFDIDGSLTFDELLENNTEEILTIKIPISTIVRTYGNGLDNLAWELVGIGDEDELGLLVFSVVDGEECNS